MALNTEMIMYMAETVYICITDPPRATLEFETNLKLGKLQCKSNFNKNKVLLLLIENFKTNQII